MRNNVNNSQSTEARNSAYVVFTSNCSKSGYLQMSISNVNYDDVIAFVGRTICEQKKDAYFNVRISNGISMEISFTKNYFSKKYEISYSVFVDGKIDYDACSSIELDFKVMSGVNVNNAVGAVARLIMEFIEDNEENNNAEISEAPMLEVAPSLEEAPMLEEFNEDGYSIEGLNYVRESMVDADMEDIVDEAYEEVSNDLYVWLNELFRSGECPKDDFMDTMWAYAWEIIMDKGLSDEALESETRYYVEFDDIVERRLEEWGLYERYNNIHMESAYSNR